MLERLDLTRPGGARAWFEADGHGGWASLPLAGRPQEAQQHLYRQGALTLAYIEEELEVGGQRYPLSSHQLEQFRLAPHPHFRYRFAEGLLEKELLFAGGRLVLRYRWAGEGTARLALTPQLTGSIDMVRAEAVGQTLVISTGAAPATGPGAGGPVGLASASGAVSTGVAASTADAGSTADDGDRLCLRAEGGTIRVEPWRDRQQYSPGVLAWQLAAGEQAYLTVGTGSAFDTMGTGGNQPRGQRAAAQLTAEVARRGQVLEAITGTAATALTDPLARALTLASDQFITLDDRLVSYPEGSLEAALISLPGLTLSTNRYSVARKNLLELAEAVVKGGDEASGLWLFQAVYQYLAHTRDVDFIRDHLTLHLEEVIGTLLVGSPQGFQVDRDTYLLLQGGQPASLKWQAFWYNALRVQAVVQQQIAKQFELGNHQGIQFYLNMASRLQEQVVADLGRRGAGEHAGAWAGTVGGQADHLFALSLAYPLIAPQSPLAQQLLATLTEQCLEPLGVRTKRGLEPWLLGPYLTAYLRVHRDEPKVRQRARSLLEPLTDLLSAAPGQILGVLPQAFSEDQPPLAVGALAWAPSVAEPLRVLLDEILD